MKLDDEQRDSLGQTLKEHLSNRLDAQTGKAAARFAAAVMRDPKLNAAPRPISRGWISGILSTGAVAAAIVIAFSVVMYRAKTKQNVSMIPPTPTAVAAQSPDDDDPVERTLYWRETDEGTVYIDDDTPARKIRRQQVEQVTWTDQESGEPRTSYSVPQEEVVLVAYNKY
jgi:hypothetical protein